MLVRYRAGVTGQTARTVHLVTPPERGQAGALGTVCGSLMSVALIETVTAGQGMPCNECVIHQLSAMTEHPVVRPDSDDDGHGDGLVDRATYDAWGWPVNQHCEQMQLSPQCDVSAIAVPIPLSAELIRILTARRCAPAVLADPDAPEHHYVLVGEKYGAMLPWPSNVHPISGALMLPPTMTPRGPIIWIQPPSKDSLRLSREIDVFGALRAALSNAPAGACSSLPI
jgi:hypothetical protein